MKVQLKSLFWGLAASTAFGTVSVQAALPAMPVGDMRSEFVSEEQATPLFTNLQGYMSAAPAGVGALSLREVPGGRGENVMVIDIEGCIAQDHEDLNFSYIGENPNCSKGGRDHGTAVTGIIGAKEDGKGMTGIAPQAALGFYGFLGAEKRYVDEEYLREIINAIDSSAAQMRAGDVLVIEQHMEHRGSRQFIPVEFWDPIFKALKRATDKGIHCLQAAGNGGQNLDADIYENKFDRDLRDSGCVLVGAGDPSRTYRLYFSNYGKIVDAFGYGSRVAATGYGDLFNRGVNRQYTRRFSGTSSATPIVAGAVALVSSIAKEKGMVITPLEMRNLLRTTGTRLKRDDQKIGTLPNAVEMLRKAGLF